MAMAAGVSLDRAIEVVGHKKERGTHTREVIAGLRALGIECAGRCRPVSRKRPVWPACCILVVQRADTNPNRWHWMLSWDGKIYDPAGVWPDMSDWRITSFLEIKA